MRAIRVSMSLYIALLYARSRGSIAAQIILSGYTLIVSRYPGKCSSKGPGHLKLHNILAVKFFNLRLCSAIVDSFLSYFIFSIISIINAYTNCAIYRCH